MPSLFSFWDRLTTNPRMQAARDAKSERVFIRKMVKGDDPESITFRNRILHDVHADRIKKWGRRRSSEKILGSRGPGGDYIQYDFEDSYNPFNDGLLLLNEKMEFNFNNTRSAKDFESQVSNSAMGLAKVIGNTVHVHVLPPRTTRVKNAIMKAAKQQGGKLAATEPYSSDSFGSGETLEDYISLHETSLGRSRVSRAGEEGRPGREKAYALRQGWRFARQFDDEHAGEFIRNIKQGLYPSSRPPMHLKAHPGTTYRNPLYGRVAATTRSPEVSPEMKTSGYGDVMGQKIPTHKSMLNAIMTMIQQRGQRLKQHNLEAQNS